MFYHLVNKHYNIVDANDRKRTGIHLVYAWADVIV